MTLHDLNILDKQQLSDALYKCCGSKTWVQKMMTLFPMDDLVELEEDAEEKWFECSEKDWLEAFSQHPEIGDAEALQKKFADTAAWADDEQAGTRAASKETLQALAEGNQEYKRKFGFIFIVCATGKSADEMLGMLHARLQNDAETEIKIAADEQSKITKLRLEKLLE